MFNPLEELREKIIREGGFVNAHAHLDRAFTVSRADMILTKNPLMEKWELVDEVKKNSSEEDYYQRICYALRTQQQKGVRAVVSFVDIDPVVELRAIHAGYRAKEFARSIGMELSLASQTLKGVLSNQSRRLLEMALSEGWLDVIGSLPKADIDPDRHLDTVFSMARAAHLPIHAHVDQNNTVLEKETELLARKTISYRMEGRVSAVHSISLACHPLAYRQMVYNLSKDAGLGYIACPTAWLDHPRNETLMPFHNALTPVDEILANGLSVAIGSDNIHDLYKPFSDGDMFTELRVLLEGCKIYDSDQLFRIATQKNPSEDGF